MPDGNFNDWLELMPKRVHVDKGEATTCPKAANITHYSAIASRDFIALGAHVKDFWEDEKNARWEVLFDFPEAKKSILLTAVSDSHQYTLKDAITNKVIKRYRRGPVVGRNSVEWAIDRNVLGIESFFNKESSVRLRFRTVFNKEGKDIYCDETAWIAPFISN
jgi:hypothetical protein